MPDHAASRRLLTLDQVADELHLHRRTVERKIAAGVIPAIRLGNGPRSPLRIDSDALDAWLDRSAARRQPLAGATIGVSSPHSGLEEDA